MDLYTGFNFWTVETSGVYQRYKNVRNRHQVKAMQIYQRQSQTHPW